MIKIKSERRRVTTHRWVIEFSNEDGAGFWFDANEQGEPVFETDDARVNYEEAIADKSAWVVYNELRRLDTAYTEPAVGECLCGSDVTLDDEYMGACQCKRCGRWYNIFGQSLNPPEMWED